jgi:hypothetical protein
LGFLAGNEEYEVHAFNAKITSPFLQLQLLSYTISAQLLLLLSTIVESFKHFSRIDREGS